MEVVRCSHVIGPTLQKTFFSYISTLLLMVEREPPHAVWYHLALSCCTMTSEVKRQGEQKKENIDYAKQHHTPHCWLPAKVMYSSNSAKSFSWLTRSIFCCIFCCYAFFIFGRLTARLICQSKTNIASLFCNGTVIA